MTDDDDAAYEKALADAIVKAYGNEAPIQQLRDTIGPTAEALPGIARVAATAAWHTGSWGAKTSLRTSRRFMKALVDPAEAKSLTDDATKAVSVIGRFSKAVSSGTSVGKALVEAAESLGELADRYESPSVVVAAQVQINAERQRSNPEQLRQRGAELLERSRDVWAEEDTHPAYDRILDELAPDEARLLVLLLEKGPQPSVDVRSGGPMSRVNGHLIASGLSMIGSRSGCRYLDQVPAYLNNLFRLGLVWFPNEPIKDAEEYQVVEAQPDVLEALHSVRFAKVIRRSIHLTPFGADFTTTCLIDELTATLTFPAHQPPPTADTD